MEKRILFENAKLILDTKIITSSVLVEKNHFVSFSSQLQNGIFAEQFNLSGQYVSPGFIDVHNHGAIGIDANEANADGLHKISKFLAAKGVTAWLPTLVPDAIENYQKSIEAIDELMQTQDNREPAARVLGVHYEGPFVNEKQCGALRTQFFKTYTNQNEFESIPKLKTPGAIHLTTVAPEIAGGIELIKKLKEHNWIISIGHTRADINTLETALTVGARHLTHFFNAMSGLHHREVGVAGWGIANDNVTFDIIADKIHVHPLMLKFACRSKTPEKTLLISDSVSPTGLGDGEFTIWNEKISVVNGRTQNGRGSIAGSVITMLDAANNMRELGFADFEISQMASLNPAKLLGIEKDYGSIEIGKQADFVAIDENGAVKLTVVGGRVAFNALQC